MSYYESIFICDRDRNLIKLFENMLGYNYNKESSIHSRVIIDDKNSIITPYNIDDVKQELITDFKINEQTADTLRMLYISYKYGCYGDGEKLEQEYDSDGNYLIDIDYSLQEHRNQLWKKIPNIDYKLIDKCLFRYEILYGDDGEDEIDYDNLEE